MVWSQDTSDLYRQLAAIAVPRREEQIAALLTLIPFAPQNAFRIVELASGEGYLARAILSAFPHVSLLALDGEASMRAETLRRCAAFADRIEAAPFDIKREDWHTRLDGVDVVLSSLCVHHLDGPQKQALFRAVARRWSGRGALLLADVVLPKNPQSRELFGATWDQTTLAASSGPDDRAFQLFLSEHWNLFRYPDDDFDKPSPLADQLRWLAEAGLQAVDCFWINAGHAVYGGYGADAGSGGLDFQEALRIARLVLADEA